MFQSIASALADRPAADARRRSFPCHCLRRITTLVTTVVAAIVSLVIGTQAVNAESNRHPNIVFIMADDK